MKKTIIILAVLLISVASIAQKEFYFGPSYTAGISTIAGSGGMNMDGGMNNGAQIDADLTFTPAFGTGIRLEYYPAWRWGLYFQCGYQQRGARFRDYMDNYNPRYRFHMCDFNLGAQLRTKGLIQNHQLLLQLGITQHYTSSAARIYDTGSDDITSDIISYDWGLYLGLGGNIPVMQKDLLQIMVFANNGFREVFMGNMSMNNMMGRNMLLGIQCSYLVGRKGARPEETEKK